MKQAKEFTSKNWEKEVLHSTKPVLVDFWAPWCGPCRMQGPLVEQLAEEIGDAAVVGKLNSNENGDIAAHYNIRSIPTLLVFKDGQPYKGFLGVTPVAQMKKVLLEAGR